MRKIHTKEMVADNANGIRGGEKGAADWPFSQTETLHTIYTRKWHTFLPDRNTRHSLGTHQTHTRYTQDTQ